MAKRKPKKDAKVKPGKKHAPGHQGGAHGDAASTAGHGSADGGTQSRFSKRHRPLGDPVSYPAHSPRFIPVPIDPPMNLTLSLDTVLYEPEFHGVVDRPDKLVFHCVGDTGPVNGYEAINPVVHAMESQFNVAEEDRPRFLYHVGDVVYFNGQEGLYDSQFYEPYQYYPGPIFAIPGNHDGDTVAQRTTHPITRSR